MDRAMTDQNLLHAIGQLQTRYIRVIDDDLLEDWPALFTPDGSYRITTRENHCAGLPMPLFSCRGQAMMVDRVSGLRKINVYEPHCYRHQQSALEIVQADEHEIHCISNFLVVRTMHTGAMSIFATGIYQDVLVDTGQGLRFRERVVITDSRQTDTLLVIPL